MPKQKGNSTMINFHNKKAKQILAIIIIVALVIAMVLPTLSYFAR